MQLNALVHCNPGQSTLFVLKFCAYFTCSVYNICPLISRIITVLLFEALAITQILTTNSVCMSKFAKFFKWRGFRNVMFCGFRNVIRLRVIDTPGGKRNLKMKINLKPSK
jgi:hypothetical protein